MFPKGRLPGLSSGWGHRKLQFLRNASGTARLQDRDGQKSGECNDLHARAASWLISGSRGAERHNVADVRSLVEELKGCIRSRNLKRGKEAHCRAIYSGLSSNRFVANSLINMYAKCGSMVDATKVFESMLFPDAVSWTSLIIGHVEHGSSELALDLFDRMEARDSQSFVAALMACTSLASQEAAENQHKWIERAKAIHSEAAMSGCLNIFVENKLVDMYGKCGGMVHSRSVFDSMVDRNDVSWNTLLQGYVENGECELALELFDGMNNASGGCAPGPRAYVPALTACANCATLAAKREGYHTWNVRNELSIDSSKKRWLEKGRSIHLQAVKTGCCDMFVESMAVDMYAKCGSMEEARKVFDNMRYHDEVSWTALVMGYVDNGENEVALELIPEVDADGAVASSAILVAGVMACANLMALERGRFFHAEICSCGFEKDTQVANCLVALYGKCGSMELAEEGYHQRVFEMLDKMKEQDVAPNELTFVCILNACSHAGLVKEGKQYFDVMYPKYGVKPDSIHYNCMVDLLSRANHLDSALSLVRSMPFEPSPVTWRALLGACRKWNNAVVAKAAYDSLLKLDSTDPAGYVLMANIYALPQQNSQPQQSSLQQERVGVLNMQQKKVAS